MDCSSQVIGLYGGIRVVPSFAELPTGVERYPGAVAVAADTNRMWEWNGTAWVLVGGPAPRAKAQKTTSQVATSAVAAIIQFGEADVYDTDAIHDTVTNNTRLTIPANMSGLWSFSYHLYVLSGSAGNVECYINKASTNERIGWLKIPVGTSDFTLTGGGETTMAAGDYVELFFYQVTGANRSAATAGLPSYLAASYRGPL